MMIAMWRGIAPCTRMRSRRSVTEGRATSSLRSDRHDIGFLALRQLVDLRDEVIVDLLEVLLGVLHVVFRHLRELLEPVAGFGPPVTNGDAPFLGELVHDFHEVLPPLLVERRERYADHTALRRWIESEIGVADRLLDHGGLALVERGHREQARLRSGDAGDLVQ